MIEFYIECGRVQGLNFVTCLKDHTRTDSAQSASAKDRTFLPPTPTYITSHATLDYLLFYILNAPCTLLPFGNLTPQCGPLGTLPPRKYLIITYLVWNSRAR